MRPFNRLRASGILGLEMTNSGRKTLILPWQGRWLAKGQTEGCPAIVRVTPLRPALRARHLPFQGRMVENHPSPSFPRRREPNSLPGRHENFGASDVDHLETAIHDLRLLESRRPAML